MASAASTNAHRVRPAELARLLGVQRQSVHELIKRHVITRGDDGLVDVELARLAIAQRVHPKGKTAAAVDPASPAATPATPAASLDAASTSYHVAKTLREAAEAQIAQLKLAEMRGELVRADEVRSAHSRRLAQLREALLQLPSRLAPVLAAETDIARCHEAVLAELHGVLAQVASQA